MLDPTIVTRIRAIFLHHEHRVTPDAAAKLLCSAGPVRR